MEDRCDRRVVPLTEPEVSKGGQNPPNPGGRVHLRHKAAAAVDQRRQRQAAGNPQVRTNNKEVWTMTDRRDDIQRIRDAGDVSSPYRARDNEIRVGQIHQMTAKGVPPLRAEVEAVPRPGKVVAGKVKPVPTTRYQRSP